jgi:Ca-activated chloride channel family protein
VLSFAYAWVFWLLPLPILVRWLVPARRGRRAAVRVSFMATLSELAGRGGRSVPRVGDRWRMIVLSLVWVLTVSALARPQWLQPPVTREQPTRDLLLLVDLSGSMEHRDFTSESGETVDRLSAVKEVLGEFLEKRQGDRVGLVVFGDAAFVQSPFTVDLDLTRQLLDETQVRMAGPRTALGDAMGLGITMFEQSELPTRTMIALTDGNDTASGVPPEKAADVAADRGITIHTVVVGDPTSVGEEKIDEITLQAVARKTGGRFFMASDRAQLATIYNELDALEAVSVKTISHRSRIDLFWIPLAIALALSLLTESLRWLASTRRERARPGEFTSPRRVRVNAATGELELRAE